MRSKFLGRMILLGLVMPILAWAQPELETQLRIEDALRQRAETYMQKFDPSATVKVRVFTGQTKVTLPMQAHRLRDLATGSSKVQSTDFDNIERVEVTVNTVLSPVPDEISKHLKTLFGGVAEKVVQVHFSSYSAKELELIEKAKPLRDSKKTAEAPTPKDLGGASLREGLGELSASLMVLSNKFLAALLSFLGVAFIVSLWMGHRRQKALASLMKEMMGALQQRAAAPERSNGPSEAGNTFMGVADENDGSTERVHRLPVPGLLNLMGDCYWCRDDEYAAWLWQRLSVEQRQALLSQTRWGREYSEYVCQLSARAERHHDHPFYLSSLALHNCSQDELARIVTREPRLLAHLSPLRSQSLVLDLELRLKNAQATPFSADELARMKWPESPLRELPAALRGFELSVADELKLLQNPTLVPHDKRATLPTLVWLAELPLPTRQAILQKYTAEDLALAWIGPDEVLNALREALPEVKARTVDGYRSTLPASRASDSYRSLVAEALSHGEGTREAA